MLSLVKIRRFLLKEVKNMKSLQRRQRQRRQQTYFDQKKLILAFGSGELKKTKQQIVINGKDILEFHWKI